MRTSSCFSCHWSRASKSRFRSRNESSVFDGEDVPHEKFNFSSITTTGLQSSFERTRLVDERTKKIPLLRSRFPAFYYDKIGLEISTDWVAKRSRVAVDEGAAKMFVAIPVKERADFARRTIEESPFLYGQLIEVFEGYGMDIELPTKVDFILYEPTAAGKAAKVLSPEENFILKMIKQKHLKFPDQWQRVLFI